MLSSTLKLETGCVSVNAFIKSVSVASAQRSTLIIGSPVIWTSIAWQVLRRVLYLHCPASLWPSLGRIGPHDPNRSTRKPPSASLKEASCERTVRTLLIQEDCSANRSTMPPRSESGRGGPPTGGRGRGGGAPRRGITVGHSSIAGEFGLWMRI